jgi:DNA-binding Lrp family transcriptional regulator
VQHKILLATVMRADASCGEIAHILGVREHIVRRTVGMFLDRRIFVRRSIFVDPFALGLIPHVIMFSLPVASLAARNQLIESLVAADEVMALTELGGDNHLELRTLTRGPLHQREFLDAIARTSKQGLHIRSCLAVLEHEYSGIIDPSVPPKYRPLMKFSGPVAARSGPPIDELDHTILSALANENYLRLEQIARKLSMPTSTVKYRISRMEGWGIIKGHYYIVDPKVANSSLFYIQVSTHVLHEEQRERIRVFCRKHPRIALMSFLMGEYSVEMLLLVQDHIEAHAVVSDLVQQCGDLIQGASLTPHIKFFKFSDYPLKRYSTLVGLAAK